MFENLNEEVRKNKGVIFSLVLSISILISLLLLVKILTEVKNYQYIGSDIVAQNTISVSGTGEIFTVPDIANVSFSIKEERKTVSEAQKNVSEKINKIMAFLKKTGIKDNDLKTTNYNSYPRYEYRRGGEVTCLSLDCPSPNQGKRVLSGYEVSQTISVKIRDINKAGEILAGLSGFNISNISGLSFSVDDEEKIQSEVRQKAIKKAKIKAAYIAEDLGVNLVRIVNYSESGYYPNYRNLRIESFMIDNKKGTSITPQIPVGENKITTTVNITYEIK